MQATKHPEFDIEQKKFAETVLAIDTAIGSLGPPQFTYGADQRAATALLKKRQERLQHLKETRKEPYFGRVDWNSENGSAPETFYVGKFALPEQNIFSWRGTMPAMLYYEGRCDEAGRRLLRRTFRLNRSEIEDIIDEFIAGDRAQMMNLALAADAADIIEGVDDLLVQLLEQTRAGKLHDIVASIQEEQFQLIRAPLDQTLVIQGVPGSGKTAIALHRLAYLLYQHEETGDLKRERILFLGPNPIFMNYVAQVLPELGERHVPQTTFDGWIVDKLGEQLSYEPEEAALETLIDPTIPLATRIMRYRNARNKGSMRMARLLDRYVAHLVDQILEDLGDFDYEFVVGRITAETIRCTLTNQDIRALFARIWSEDSQSIPLNQAKVEFTRQLTEAALKQLRKKTAHLTAITDEETLERRRSTQVGNWVADYLRPWEALNVSVAYRGLFRSGDLLQRLGHDIFNPWDLELMHIDAPKQGTPFRFGDLGALLYFHLLINGIEKDELLDHLVIDEAQDVTPIQFAVFNRYSRTQSMTIIGDLTQGIYADHGLHSWNELIDVMGQAKVAQRAIHQSYRSTEPIIRFANEILRRCKIPEEYHALPLARQGPEPHTGCFADEDERSRKIVALIDAELAEGRSSIAIITKTLEGCHEMALELEIGGITQPVQIIDQRDVTYGGGIAVIPVYLAKGLEFDTVIIPDADAESYAPLLLDMRLLFVAVTRASHSLHIGWIGEQSPLLRAPAESIELVDFYGEQHDPRLDTVAALAASPEIGHSADYCLERLAAEGKLYLLQDGVFDFAALGVLAGTWRRGNGDEETRAPDLDPQVKNAIRVRVRKLANNNDPDTTRALTFLQLTYGLLRNVLRSVDISLADGEDSDMQEQAVALATFLNAMRTTTLAYSLGARTTERRTLEAVDPAQHDEARRYLHHLLDHGIVERFTQTQGDRLRVSYDWVESLVATALGHQVSQWDLDLRQELPHLPHPISQQVLADDVAASSDDQTALPLGVA